jgi:hypothetical protein
MRPLGDHAVYWAGPLLGALAAAVFYTFVLLPDDRPEAPRGAWKR